MTVTSSSISLQASGTDFWIIVGNLAVNVIRSDEGVVVDVWPHRTVADGPIASAYAFFNEVAS